MSDSEFIRKLRPESCKMMTVNAIASSVVTKHDNSGFSQKKDENMRPVVEQEKCSAKGAEVKDSCKNGKVRHAKHMTNHFISVCLIFLLLYQRSNADLLPRTCTRS